MTVLVTGATGLIGRSLMKSLIADRETIHVLSRDEKHARALFRDGGLKTFAWQPESEDLPAEALAGVRTVFHLMGEPVGRWTKAKVQANHILACHQR